MPNPSTELAALLREHSRHLRRCAKTTRANSRRLHGQAGYLCDAARGILIASFASSRRRIAGGSDHLDEAPPSLARSIAHELTPALATLQMRLDAMLDEVQGDEPLGDLRGDLEILRRRVGQMVVIVRALAALDGEAAFDLHPFDLNGLVEHLLSSITERRAGRVVVHRNLDRGIPEVLADAEALRYALANLIETVAAVSPTLDVATRRETNGSVRVDVGASSKPGTARELTLQADPLPLVLAQAIVRSLGGTVEQRIANPGRVFTVTLRPADAR